MTKKKKTSPTTKSAPELSFRMTIRKPICVKADGTFDCLRLSGLIAAAKEGNQEAKVRVFEQYQYLWRGIITKNKGMFEPTVVDKEDLQQEAAVALLKALKDYDPKVENSFSSFYENLFTNHLYSLLRNQRELVEGNLDNEQICSLNAFGEDGNPLYQIGTEPNQEEAFLSQLYPKVSPLLNQREMEVACRHFLEGFPIKIVAKELSLTTRAIDKIIAKIRDKLSILNK